MNTSHRFLVRALPWLACLALSGMSAAARAQSGSYCPYCPRGGACRAPIGQPNFGPAASSQFVPGASWSAAAAGAGQTPNPAVVRVIVTDRDGMSLGSGTLIYVTDRHGLVITNWHVVRDGAGPVEVAFPDGFRSAGTVIKVDNAWDLAAIGIWKPNVAPVELAMSAPQPGEMLTIAGYGSGNYRAVSGRCLQYVSPGTNYPYQIIELGAEARHGDSGGPIFNQRGQLAGVLLGARDGTTVGSYCGRVGTFLADVTPLLDQQRTDGKREMIASATPPGDPRAAQPPRREGDVARSPGAANDGRWESPSASNWKSSTAVAALGEPAVAPQVADESQPGWPRTATTSPQPRGWLGSTDSSASLAAASTGRSSHDQYLHWEDVAGTTRGEQAKTLLAAVGAIAILLTALRLLLAM